MRRCVQDWSPITRRWPPPADWRFHRTRPTVCDGAGPHRTALIGLWLMNKIAAISEIRPTSAISVPDTTVSARETFGVDTDHGGSGLHRPDRARSRHRRRLPLRPGDDARDPRRLCVQSPRHDPGLSWHRQVHAYRAGRGAAELALHPRQPRQPYQPHRPDRQGRDRAEGRQAGHRVPRGHPALGACSTPARWCSTNTTPAGPT